MRRGILVIALALTACSAAPASPASPTAAPARAGDPVAELDAAQQQMFGNRYAAAAQAYSSIVRDHDGSAIAHADRALFLNYTRDLAGARLEADRAAQLAPADPHVAAARCRVDDWAARLATAVPEGRNAVAGLPDDPLAHLFLSEALADSGDAGAASKELDAAARLIGASAPAYLRAELHRERANAAHDRGDTAGQLAELTAARDAQPGWIERTSELVDAQNAAGDVAGARNALDASLALVPDDTATLASLGSLALADSDFPAAKTLFDRALARTRSDPAVLAGRAEVAVALDRDLDTAERLLAAALRLDPENGGIAGFLFGIDADLRGDPPRGLHVIAEAVNGTDHKGLLDRTPPDPLAQQDADAQRALDAVNAARRSAALPPVSLESHLDDSARRHALYWLFNNASPDVVGLGIHHETAGSPGFVGVNSWNRAAALGYPNERIGEDITHHGDPVLAVGDWVNSVYHRFAIVRPDLVAVGFGDAHVGPLVIEDMEFGFAPPARSAPVLYPGDGQAQVPAIFVDNELPDPVPAGQPRTTGYPVTADWGQADSVRLQSFTLHSAAGAEAPGYVIGPSVLSENSATLLPAAPLQAKTVYTATLSAVVNGAAQTWTWSFTTAG
jgi:tetratricopeptide (TPR) repeat protein